jgi:hypothetical protein
MKNVIPMGSNIYYQNTVSMSCNANHIKTFKSCLTKHVYVIRVLLKTYKFLSNMCYVIRKHEKCIDAANVNCDEF